MSYTDENINYNIDDNETSDNEFIDIDDDFEMSDPFECIHLEITEDTLSNAKLAAYMLGQQFYTPEGELEPYNPKNFPEKAIDIFIPHKNSYIEIYLDSKEKLWDSSFVIDGKFGKLSPDQMERIFKLEKFVNLVEKIENTWPLTDPFYSELFYAVQHKQLRIGMTEDDLEKYNNSLIFTNKDKKTDSKSKAANAKDDNLEEVDQAHKRVDLANKDLTGDGVRDYSGSGRKIIHFGDMGILGKSIRYFCWPRRNKTFKWNTWANWEKIKPFARMTFMYNGREYMVTIALTDEGLKNRGFRGADLTWTPPLAWLTPAECDEVMRLSRVKRFIRQCVLRTRPLLDMTPEEIYAKIDRKDKVDVKQIEKTQRVIRSVIHSIFMKEQIDNYTYD